MIRLATTEDVINIIPLVQLFAKRIRQEKNFRVKEVAGALSLMVDSGILVIALEDDEVVGVAGGTFGYTIWNPHIKLFSEEIFYVRPRFRGRTITRDLITKLTRDALRSGAKALSVKKMFNSPKIDELYESLGYKKLETTFMMEA